LVVAASIFVARVPFCLSFLFPVGLEGVKGDRVFFSGHNSFFFTTFMFVWPLDPSGRIFHLPVLFFFFGLTLFSALKRHLPWCWVLCLSPSVRQARSSSPIGVHPSVYRDPFCFGTPVFLRFFFLRFSPVAFLPNFFYAKTFLLLLCPCGPGEKTIFYLWYAILFWNCRNVLAGFAFEPLWAVRARSDVKTTFFLKHLGRMPPTVFRRCWAFWGELGPSRVFGF